ncbi:MAG: hypothetical protein K0R12_1252 [Gammaproteobacteria bacterium]|nr:hypothetical protein [Gammaproteobacteria bacterium]
MKQVLEKTLVIFWLFIPGVVLADDSVSADVLAGQLANSAQSVFDTNNSQAMLSSLGVSATMVGDGGDPLDMKGAEGSMQAHFSFKKMPACSSGFTNKTTGLNGSPITIPCADTESNSVSVTTCTKYLDEKSCKPSDSVTFSLPLNNAPTLQAGATWQATCNSQGVCEGVMTETQSVVTSSETMSHDARNQSLTSPIYKTVLEGQNANTQTLLSAFLSDTSVPSYRACMGDVPGVFIDGIYHSCDGQSTGSFEGCHDVTACVASEEKEVPYNVTQVCHEHFGRKNQICTSDLIVTHGKSVEKSDSVPIHVETVEVVCNGGGYGYYNYNFYISLYDGSYSVTRTGCGEPSTDWTSNAEVQVNYRYDTNYKCEDTMPIDHNSSAQGWDDPNFHPELPFVFGGRFDDSSHSACSRIWVELTALKVSRTSKSGSTMNYTIQYYHYDPNKEKDSWQETCHDVKDIPKSTSQSKQTPSSVKKVSQ